MRHGDLQTENSITSPVRDFPILTALAGSEKVVGETPPSDTSRRAVDLTTLDTFIEFKRHIGTTASREAYQYSARQLDDYLGQSASHGRVRKVVLADDKWVVLHFEIPL